MMSELCEERQQAVLYVSPGGSDRNPGTLEKPFATLEKARDAVRSMNRDMQGDIVVHIRGGRYYLKDSLLLDERDSGSNGFNVWYKAYPGETPVLYGGRRITDWAPHSDTIYKTFLQPGESCFNLLENGRRARVARFPKQGYLLAGDTVPEQSGTAFRAREGELPGFEPAAAQAFTWPGDAHWNWMSCLTPIKGADFEQGIISLQDAPADQEGGRPDWAAADEGSRYFLQNALAFLSEPGEFFMDSERSTLYYKPVSMPVGEQEIILAALPQLIVIKGSSLSHLASHIRIEGLVLNLSDSQRYIPLPYSNGYWAEPEMNRKGMVYLENASHITIQGCKLMNAGLHGIVLNRYAQTIPLPVTGSRDAAITESI